MRPDSNLSLSLSIEKSEGESRTRRVARRKAPAEVSIETLPHALLENDLFLVGRSVPVAVLEDETRLLTQRGMSIALGRAKNPNRGNVSIENRPVFLPQNLDDFINPELRELCQPVYYISKRTGGFHGKVSIGYRAEALPHVCYVYLDAAKAGGVLHPRQRHIAEVCEVLARAMATVGIIALIDEATGYQDLRDRMALQVLLDKWVLKTEEWRRHWNREFQMEFYRELYRLNGWTFDETTTKRPGVIGRWTNDWVYDRLAPGLLERMKRDVPRNNQGKPVTKLFMGLTEEHGLPELRQYLHTLVAMMRGSSTRASFNRLLDRAFPSFRKTPALPGLDTGDDD